eukprot:scaffold6575_cov136-Skeletonema_marinoi.AAC.1
MATTTPVSLMKVMPYKGVGCLEKRFQRIVLREKGRKQCRELDAVEVRSGGRRHSDEQKAGGARYA